MLLSNTNFRFNQSSLRKTAPQRSEKSIHLETLQQITRSAYRVAGWRNGTPHVHYVLGSGQPCEPDCEYYLSTP